VQAPELIFRESFGRFCRTRVFTVTVRQEDTYGGFAAGYQEGAFEARDAGKVIVPGNPSASLLIQRVMAADVARRMPAEYSP